MKNVEKDNQQNTVFELFRNTHKGDLNYIYRGIFSPNITDNILALAETSIDNAGEPSKIKKRVYLIMVEGLQNITKHQTKVESIEKSGFFIIQKKKHNYSITTANLIKKDEIDVLKGHIEKINGLEREDLKKYYRNVLTYGKVSSKGGAGLGLIDMAKRSGNKLKYLFGDFDDEYSFFYLQTAVQSLSSDLTGEYKQENFSLDNIVHLHQLINKDEILLIINSVFTQDSLLSLLSIIERQLTQTIIFRKKVYNVMVEMLQNIIHHGSSVEDDEGKPGIFFISEKSDEYLLNTGNFIKNPEIDNFKTRIEHVNSLDNNELDEFYNRRLLDFDIDTSKEAGLGIIDIRIKSDKKLVYSFYKVSEKYSFFTLQISVSKN